MITIDFETCGLHGVPVLLQYAEDDGEVELHSVWLEPIKDTLDIIEWIVYHPGGILGFNLAFDWFHLNKIYNIFKLAYASMGNIYPVDHIDEIAEFEMEARDGLCLKPVTCLDLMLHARKGPYQSLMNRDDIRIRKVPTVLAYELAKELGQRIPIRDIFFARKKDKTLDKWQVYDIEDLHGEYDPDFKDIVCRFSASTALKALALDTGIAKEEDILKFDQVSCDRYPEEVGWAPFAKAMGGDKKNWKGAWPEVIKTHITHWGYNPTARLYAKNDIVYTRALKKHFKDPPMGDTDSILACMVASVRWKGYKVDIPGMIGLREHAIGKSKEFPRAANQVKNYLHEVMNEEERASLFEGTGKKILEDIALWTTDDETGKHPAAIRAKNVLDARGAEKEVEIYDKILQAGRFHASFVVIGTKSFRMSGADGLNAQGIKKANRVRSKFLFAWDGQILSGGDFSSFEVSLAAAVYNDPKLIEDLKSGKKFAGLIGMALFPEMDYDEIVDSDGEEDDKYTIAKQAGFSWIFGGNEATWKRKLGIDMDIGKEAIKVFEQKYVGIAINRKRIEKMFCSMKQVGGIGTRIEWHEPADFISSKLGDKRYYTLENRITKALFTLANKPPKHWLEFKMKLTRRDREQTAYGAAQSALYAAAFGIQSSNLRSGGNHEIQCFGARILKEIEGVTWEFQPIGIHEWVIMPFNCHDELECPHEPSIAEPLKKAVLDKVETYRPLVPLIKLEWGIGLKGWKGKGA